MVKRGDICLKNRQAQITIFVILAMIIVVGIIIVFVMMKNVPTTPSGTIESADSYIDKCIRDAVTPSIESIFPNGGRIKSDFFILYNNTKYNYLCYNAEYEKTCVNLYPALKTIVENEIKSNSKKKVESCFENMQEEFANKGYNYWDTNDFDYNIELAPKRVLIKIKKNIEISRDGSSQKYSKFDSSIISPLYDLVFTARDIVNQEAQSCYFEQAGFMLLHPEYEINRISYDKSRIYTIMDKESQKIFKFAVRSCAMKEGV